MLVLSEFSQLRKQIFRWQADGQRWALVPTMGGLHRGHLSLIERAKSVSDHVVLSIFVNPTQFNCRNDFQQYPRTVEGDAAAVEHLAVDVLLVPSEEEVYSQGWKSADKISAGALGQGLCGDFRPGHFDGVATVLHRFFSCLMPDVTVFGRKDYQQLMIIRHMVAEQNWPIRVEGIDTVRESSGLAMSSRNTYLNEEEKQIAPMLYRTLRGLADDLKLSLVGFAEKAKVARQSLCRTGFVPEYISLRNRRDFSSQVTVPDQGIILGAACLGEARLIDNVFIARPTSGN